MSGRIRRNAQDEPNSMKKSAPSLSQEPDGAIILMLSTTSYVAGLARPRRASSLFGRTRRFLRSVWAETVRQLERRLERCHPTNRRSVKAQLRNAQNNKGATVFDWLVEIIRVHGVGGEEAEDNVILKLQ